MTSMASRTNRVVRDMCSSFGARESLEGGTRCGANEAGLLACCQETGDIDDQVTTVQNPKRMPPDSSPAAGETIGQRLKRLRLEQGLSQRELAAPGVSYAYISRIEAGTRQPSVKALRRLAAKLGVTADFLETGSQLGAEEQRELRLADLELSVRLGDGGDAKASLLGLLDEALVAGDGNAALRARVSLATLALEDADWARAAALLESALEGLTFAPVDHYDIYARLGRAYAAAGRAHEAVALYEQCIEGVGEAGGDASLEARYAALLSYALSDLGDLARAEEVVSNALSRLDETTDPYMRVRLYWSMARLAHTEGRASVALANIRKAIALLQATDDTLHLARAHILAAGITLSREDADGASLHLDRAEQLLGMPVSTEDLVEIATHRSHIATIRGQGAAATSFAREALTLISGHGPGYEGRAFAALGDGLTLTGDLSAADDAYRRGAELLEANGQWRDAANTCRAWARMLRESEQEAQALDVLERATELGMRVSLADSRSKR
jgi:transcriptional regulator with XRE-family HTH domain